MALIKCPKCGTSLNDDCIVVWKCNECGKAVKLNPAKLYKVQELKKQNAGKHLLKCSACGSSLDDGNEKIVCKCSSCGNVIGGNLEYFVSNNKDVIDSQNSSLIQCPECGKEISAKAKKCVHCGVEFMEESKRYCTDCGKVIPSNVTECPNCGCPIEAEIEKTKINKAVFRIKPFKKNIKNTIIPVAAFVFVLIICIALYNIKVVQPKKIEAQNEAIYDEAIELLEKGKYDEGNELLQSIIGYKDVDTILEQIKWESYTYECINNFKTWLKNPDSFTLYDVVFYLDDESHGIYSSILGDVDFSYPAIVFRSGAQNGFGGNTTGYELFYYFKDEGYTCVGSCDSLDENEYYNDKGELKDEDDGSMKVFLCKEINELKAEAEQVGEVDMNRIKSIIKNDSYSTIKIIE